MTTHYNYVREFTDIDESGWELVCDTATLFIPKSDLKDYDAWVVGQQAIIDRVQEYSHIDNIESYVKHILESERAFLKKDLNFEGLSDSELSACFVNKKFKNHKKEILQAFGTSRNVCMKYWSFFMDIVYRDNEDLTPELEKKLPELCEKYSDDLQILIDLLIVFASIQVYKGKINKGIAIFENIFEKDKLNVFPYICLAEALEAREEYDLQKKYSKLGLNIAQTVEDETAIDIFIEELEYITDKIEHKPYEIYSDDFPTIREILEDPDEFNDVSKLVEEINDKLHSDLDITIYYSEDKEKADNAANHVIQTKDFIMSLFKDNEKKKEFLKLTETQGEHEALHNMMGIE